MGRTTSAHGPPPPFWANPGYRDALWLLLKAAVVLEAGLWALSPVLKGDWYGDDSLYLTTNPLLYDPHRIWKAWFDPGSLFEYYPLTETIQWYQWQLWGLDSPFPYLVCNLALHLTSALLFWRLLSQLGLKLAWLGALVFAIHPLVVDSVGTASQLKNTLSLPPFLLAMSFYLDFETSRKTRSYFLALLMFLVAMLCKITMDFFPIVILLYAWWKRGRITWRDTGAALPFLLVSLILGFMTVHFRAEYDAVHHYHSPGPISLGGPLARTALAGLSLSFYFGHSFLPVHAMPLYPLWRINPISPWFLVPWLGIGLVLVTCCRRLDTWGRPVLFGLAFFVLGLAPFLGFIEVSYMCLSWVFDHLLYIPVLSLIALVVAGLEHAGSQPSRSPCYPAIVVVTLAIAFLGWQTRAYAATFADHEALYRYNLEWNPDSWFTRHLYAGELAKRDENEEAIAQLREALRLNPTFDNAQFALGIDLCKIGNFAGAVTAFQDCLRVDPRYGAAHLYLGIALVRTNQPSTAIEQFSTFLKIQPNSSDAHLGLGQALARAHRVPEAIDELETALQLDPANEIIARQLDALKRLPSQPPGGR